MKPVETEAVSRHGSTRDPTCRHRTESTKRPSPRVQCFSPQTIVIGYLNDTVTHVYGRLVEIIRDRNLRTVTLSDVFR